MSQAPHIITFEKIGSSYEGYISVASISNQISFSAERIFWTYATPSGISRGRHAHYQTEMILIAMNKSITIKCEDVQGNCTTFKLEHPNQGLFVPKLCWHEMFYDEGAVQLAIASTPYDENDYIRNYKDFQEFITAKKASK